MPEDNSVVEILSSPSPSPLPVIDLNTSRLARKPAVVAKPVPDPVLEPGLEPDSEPKNEPELRLPATRKRKIKMVARKSSRAVKEEGGQLSTTSSQTSVTHRRRAYWS